MYFYQKSFLNPETKIEAFIMPILDKTTWLLLPHGSRAIPTITQ
jgi:hypothetical protein